MVRKGGREWDGIGGRGEKGREWKRARDIERGVCIIDLDFGWINAPDFGILWSKP
jgi:hypothetical protein